MRKSLQCTLLILLACLPLAYATPQVLVQPGDSWYSIATRHNLTADVLQSLNTDRHGLHPGDVLNLPEGARYIVQPGESLQAIAQQHKTTLGALMAANNLTEPLVNPGTMLRLPDTAPVETITVEEGDTLYHIALGTGVSVDELMRLNNLDGLMIHPGDTLIISGNPEALPEGREPLRVTVQPGDNLWQIARNHNVTVNELASSNNLTTSSVLHPGQQLTIPGQVAPRSTQVGGVATQTITVGKGDTLFSLAREHHTTVAALLSANDLSNPQIYVGQRLRVIPAGELTPATSLRPTAPGQLMWPADGVITSNFGYRTLPGVSSHMHNGIDINANTGDPVYAAAAGVVTKSGWEGGLGNAVFIQAGNVEFRYGHNSELLVREGQHVQAGQVIAKAGNTGFSFGTHVHFEVRVDGQPVDPLPLLQN